MSPRAWPAESLDRGSPSRTARRDLAMNPATAPTPSRSRRPAALLALALAAVLAAPLAALAGTSSNVTATATITGGALALSSAATPSVAVTLDGLDKTPTYTVPITITDPRGTGAGWNVTLTSTTFTTGGQSLSTSASSVTSVTSACGASSTCTNATNAIAFPVTVPAAATAPAAVKIFNAALNTGMGLLTVTPTVQVAVPANVFAGSYTSTLTLAVVT